MLRLYSKGCEYAIRALADIAAHGQDANVRVQDVCGRTRLPQPSTRKMLQALTQRGFLRSVPGPKGGYRLSRRPARISILDVIRAVDGESALDGCVLGLTVCGKPAPCALHATWRGAKRVLLPALGSLTLADVTRSER